MNKISGTNFTPNTIPLRGPVSVKKSESEPLPQDGFTPGVSADIQARPIFKSQGNTRTYSDLSAMANSSPVTGGSVSAGTVSPLFFGMGGMLAKWLITTEQEKEIGKILVEQVEQQFTVSDDPALNARVSNLGAQIAANAKTQGIDYVFKVIDDDTINAFACPGGHVYVHRGLLEKFPDDAHLAFILGHEVGHIENRDSVEKLGNNFVNAIIMSTLGKTPGKLDDILIGGANMLVDNQISQKDEFQADKRGAQHMKKLGYSAKQGAEALRKLDSLGQKQPWILEKLFSTHPPSQDRAARLDKMDRD